MRPHSHKTSSFITGMIKFTRGTDSAMLALGSTKSTRSWLFDRRRLPLFRNIVLMTRITWIFVLAWLGFLVVAYRGCLIRRSCLKIQHTQGKTREYIIINYGIIHKDLPRGTRWHKLVENQDHSYSYHQGAGFIHCFPLKRTSCIRIDDGQSADFPGFYLWFNLPVKKYLRHLKALKTLNFYRFNQSTFRARASPVLLYFITPGTPLRVFFCLFLIGFSYLAWEAGLLPASIN